MLNRVRIHFGWSVACAFMIAPIDAYSGTSCHKFDGKLGIGPDFTCTILRYKAPRFPGATFIAELPEAAGGAAIPCFKGSISGTLGKASINGALYSGFTVSSVDLFGIPDPATNQEFPLFLGSSGISAQQGWQPYTDAMLIFLANSKEALTGWVAAFSSGLVSQNEYNQLFIREHVVPIQGKYKGKAIQGGEINLRGDTINGVTISGHICFK